MQTAITPEIRSAIAEDGFALVPGVLTRGEAADVRRHLVAAAEQSRLRGAPTYIPTLDPSDRNVRVFNLSCNMIALQGDRECFFRDNARSFRAQGSHQT